MKTLIACIENPERTDKFVEYALRLADYLETDADLLYVEEPNPYRMGAADITDFTEKNIEKSFEHRALMLKEQINKGIRKPEKKLKHPVEPKITIERGEEARILERKRGSNPDAFMVLIEIQEKENLGIKNSHTRGLVSSLNCPALVVPVGTSFKPFQKVVYATNYSKEDIPLLNNISGLLKASQPAITALHVTDSKDFEENIMEAGFTNILHKKTGNDRIKVQTLLENGKDDLATTISNYCTDQNTDLLVMLQEHTGFLKRVFTESPADTVLKQVELPVLVYHHA